MSRSVGSNPTVSAKIGLLFKKAAILFICPDRLEPAYQSERMPIASVNSVNSKEDRKTLNSLMSEISDTLSN